LIPVRVAASDPDADPIASLTADRSALPPGNQGQFSAGAGNTSGTLSWTPAAGDARPLPYPVVFTASNALSGSATTAITVAAAPEPSSNLVGNPSFEASTAGWSANGTGATIQRVAGGYDGAYALEMRGAATGTSKFGVNDSPNWVTATPAVGAAYRLTAWVRSASAAGQGMLRVREYVAGVEQGTTKYSPAVTLTPTWQMITMVSTATVAGSTIDLQVVDQPVAPAEVFQTDNVSIAAVPGGSAAPTSPGSPGSARAALAPVLAPNPHSDATLAFTTSMEGKVQVRIYDARGRFVRSLLDESRMPPGRHVVRFDGRDVAGKWLPSGIYFYRLETQEGSVRGRIVRVQ
jgi:hypothetical protein